MRYLLCGRINAFPDGSVIATGIDTMPREHWEHCHRQADIGVRDWDLKTCTGTTGLVATFAHKKASYA
jgi:hypothetical protein